MTQINSKLIEIEVPEVFDNDFIEQKLSEMGIEPLRWAVVSGSRVWKLEGRALPACRAVTDRWRRKRLHCKRHRSNLANKIILTVSAAFESL
ncbi:MAG TPA: hypothetical protein PLG15_07080 [Candidatus Gastranaerophilaceae bacterium]|nr:hypothetical protein [Candidatus Gastranaerophilaceae bacterium]HPT42130.1 hypothetical protein [Candidatus Gastranaerophilaceae bacterium]